MSFCMKSLSSTAHIHLSARFYAPVPLAYTKYSSSDRSDLPPLVIVHGLFGQKQNFNSIAKTLHERLGSPVFTVDARNHGDSPHTSTMTYKEMAEDLEQFIDKLAVGRVNLLGHSMGGKIVMELSMKNGEKVNKLIVEDSSPMGYPQGAPAFQKMVDDMRRVNMSRSRSEVREDLEMAIPDKATRQFILTNLSRKSEWKCNLDAIYTYVKDVLPHPVSDGVFHGSTLFILGGESRYVPEEHQTDIRKRFPKVEFNTIPGAGHVIHLEKPQLFIESVCKFLTT